MDFRFTPEQEVLRKEFEEFFKAEEKSAPEGWLGGLEARYENDENWAYHRAEAEKLAQKGWLSLPWPLEYGGRDLGLMEQAIFNETCAYYRIPGADFWGLQMLAPSLLEYGSEEIKQEWLPRIARGEIDWCQGWSEPNAGSDLASLTTRAIEDGDDYVINGQKIWTTGAHRATHMFLLARSDPGASKHAGLTYFLTEIDRPGITIRPLHYMNRSRLYNEVFFDNLRIPKSNIVGQPNQGWYVTLAGMNFERSGAGAVSEVKRDLEDLVQFCKETSRNGQPLAKNLVVRQKLTELATEVEAARQFAYYVVWMQSQNPMVVAEPSAAKVLTSELSVRLANTGLEIMGLYGTLKQGSKWAPLQGKFESKCQLSLGFTIAAGSTEIQKNLIARMGLQLPRE